MLRKLQLIVLLMAMSMVTFAQVSDDFEGYNAGEQLVTQAVAQGLDYWTTWSEAPGSAEDPMVSADYGSNSIVIAGTNDAVLLLGDKTVGVYNLEFDVYVPTGFYGYFNVLQAFAGANSEWGMQAFLDAGGVATVDAGGEGAGAFTYSYDTWFTVQMTIDLDSDFAEMWVDGTSVITWVWSGGTFGTGTLNQIAALNLYAWADNGTPGTHFDNISFEPVATVGLFEDFEVYNAGGKLVEQALAQGFDYWTCWSGNGGAGGPEDATVSADQAFSGANSVMIDGTNDIVMMFGDKTGGKFSVDFYMYVPTGFVGYYNILQAWVPGGAGAVWGLEVYFDPGGVASINADGTTGVEAFTYDYDTWFHMEHIINLNTDEATIMYEGTEILTWQWSNGASSTGGINQLSAMDIYAAATNGSPKAYFDDITLIQLEPAIGDPQIEIDVTSFDFEIQHPESETEDMNVANVGVNNLNYTVAVIYQDAADAVLSPKVMKGDIVDTYDFNAQADAMGGAVDGTDAIVCPNGSLISQPSVAYTSAYTADAENGYTAFQSFEGGGYISALRFWVIDYWNDGTTWSGCDGGDPRNFNIGFYANNGNKPGVEIAMETISATRVNTGELFSGTDPIYEYTVELSSPVLCAEGWFSIQGISTTSDCWTLLLNQPGGAGSCMQFNGTAFSQQDEPLGFCLVGEAYPTWLSFNPEIGEVAPGSNEDVAVECFTNNLEAPATSEMYYATILVNSNDPEMPVVEIPVTLNLTAGQVELDPPTDLEAEVIDNDVNLTWVSPLGPSFDPEWIGYSNGPITNSIGTDGAANFDVAARFTTADLSEFNGGSVTKLNFVPGEDAATCTYTLKVWQGAGNPTLIYSQELSSVVADDWNEVVLDSPVPFDNTQELWFGFNCNTTAGFPAGCDDGPQDEGLGNMMYWDGAWTTLTGLAPTLTFNWAVEAYVEAAGIKAKLAPVAQTTPAPIANVGTLSSRTEKMTPPAIFAPQADGRALTGYNVYRNEVKIASNLVVRNYLDENLVGGNYDYYVTAVYDEGESGPSNVVSVVVVSINDMNANVFSMYPNPANTQLNVSSNVEVTSVRIMNYAGQLVYSKAVSGTELQINTSEFAAGIYVIQLETTEGVSSQKLIIE